MIQINWVGDHMRVAHQTQTANPTTGGMDIDDHGAIEAPPEWWLAASVTVLENLLGQRSASGEYLLAPTDIDPDMLGQLVATMITNRRSRR